MKGVLIAVAVAVPMFVFALNACKKDETANGASSASASVMMSASGAASLTALTSASDSAAMADPGTPTADPDKLPAPTAAATQAAQSVSSANYKTELDSIEKELNGIK